MTSETARRREATAGFAIPASPAGNWAMPDKINLWININLEVK